MSAQNPLTAAFEARKAVGQVAFMPFLVLGDPDGPSTLDLADALVEAGADALEFGFAFSDPPADGPVIQAADQRALAMGITPPEAFALLEQIHLRHQKPTALLMYFNLILQYGIDAFYARAAEVGVHGVLVADVPLEASAELVEAARRHGIAPIFIASALSSPGRLKWLAELADGFLYAVARIGITGERDAVDPTLAETLSRLKAAVDLPVLAGFGISTPAHVTAARAAGADGAIVGSALVRQIEAQLHDPEARRAAVKSLATDLAGAAHAVCW